MARHLRECYPDFSAELEAIRENGITPGLLSQIIRKHRGNSCYNHKLLMRYKVCYEGVPIFGRTPRFDHNDSLLNNQLNNDFFSEIIDIKTGYFAGKPIAYSYSTTKESEIVTGSEDKVDAVSKTLTDFVVHTNMYDVDMQCVKYAAICGYGARLFYIDKSGKENVMSVLPDQAAILFENNDISNPEYGVRYYKTKDLNNRTVCKAEFYDESFIYIFSGGSFNSMIQQGEPIPHMFDRCPLQGIPNNDDMIGDAEKVLSLIDAYDRYMSDSSNEIENFANAYMVFENINITPEEIAESQKSGSIQFFSGSGGGKVYYLTKDFNGEWQEKYAKRLETNIRYESGTPNMADETYSTASGVSLKYKLIPLETKCGMLQAKMQAAGMYMFELLTGSWKRRLNLNAVPEQCVMEFKRNFPLDALSEAQAAQAMIASGLPKQLVYGNAYSFVDDVSYVMQLIAEEEGDVVSLYNPEEDQEN